MKYFLLIVTKTGKVLVYRVNGSGILECLFQGEEWITSCYTTVKEFKKVEREEGNKVFSCKEWRISQETDTKQLRIGTKVKVINSPDPRCLGAIGYLCIGSCFHRGDLTDNNEHYWIDKHKNSDYDESYERLCIGSRTNFKVLKY